MFEILEVWNTKNMLIFVAGINKKCTYDEHCIEGAYCMNQLVCKCKDTTPNLSDDGSYCSGTSYSAICR